MSNIPSKSVELRIYAQEPIEAQETPFQSELADDFSQTSLLNSQSGSSVVMHYNTSLKPGASSASERKAVWLPYSESQEFQAQPFKISLSLKLTFPSDDSYSSGIKPPFPSKENGPVMSELMLAPPLMAAETASNSSTDKLAE